MKERIRHAALLALFTCTQILNAQSFDIAPGARYTWIAGINSKGTVAGSLIERSSDLYRAFIYRRGQATFLSAAPYGSCAQGINEAGDVSGYRQFPWDPTHDHAFLYTRDGQMLDLAASLVPGDSSCIALNNHGDVMGMFGDVWRTFLYRNGQTVDIGVLPGDDATEGKWLSESGDVLGQSYRVPWPYNYHPHYAFLYRGGRMIKLSLGGDYSAPVAINGAGDAIGYDGNWNGGTTGFLYTRYGQMFVLAMPGATYCKPQAVNEAGQVVGEYRLNGNWRTFLYTDGQMRDVGTLGGSTTQVLDPKECLGSKGDLVGSSSTDGDQSYHAFLYRDGQMRDLGTLAGHTFSRAVGMNDSGDVVGTSFDDNGNCCAFLYRNGQMTDLGTLGGTKAVPYLINAAGEIVGSSTTDGDATYETFLYKNGQMQRLWPSLYGGLHLTDTGFVTSECNIPGPGGPYSYEQHGFLFDPSVIAPGYHEVAINKAFTEMHSLADEDHGFSKYYDREDVSYVGVPFRVKTGEFDVASTQNITWGDLDFDHGELTAPGNSRIFVLGFGTWLASSLGHAHDGWCGLDCPGPHLRFEIRYEDGTSDIVFPEDAVTGEQKWGDIFYGDGAVDSFEWQMGWNPAWGYGTGFIHMYQLRPNRAKRVSSVTLHDQAGTGDWVAPFGDYTVIAMTVYNGEDTAPPETSASATPEPNGNGWYGSDVTVAFSAHDHYQDPADPADSAKASGVKEIRYRITNGGAVSESRILGKEGTIVVTAEGVNVVEFYAMDHFGNAEAAQTLTVKLDKTPPVIGPTPDVTVDEGDPLGTVVSLTPPTVRDNLDPHPALTSDAPALFQLGATTVTWTSIDIAGNQSQATQKVTVVPGSAANQIANLRKLIGYLAASGEVGREAVNSLLAKLSAAAASVSRGSPSDIADAISQLNALISYVHAQTGKLITAGAAARIIERANRIIASLKG